MNVRYDCMKGGRWVRLICWMYGYHSAEVLKGIQTCYVCGATREKGWGERDD